MKISIKLGQRLPSFTKSPTSQDKFHSYMMIKRVVDRFLSTGSVHICSQNQNIPVQTANGHSAACPRPRWGGWRRTCWSERACVRACIMMNSRVEYGLPAVQKVTLARQVWERASRRWTFEFLNEGAVSWRSSLMISMVCSYTLTKKWSIYYVVALFNFHNYISVMSTCLWLCLCS